MRKQIRLCTVLASLVFATSAMAQTRGATAEDYFASETLGRVKGALHIGGRGYFDTWGVTSGTGEAELEPATTEPSEATPDPAPERSTDPSG